MRATDKKASNNLKYTYRVVDNYLGIIGLKVSSGSVRDIVKNILVYCKQNKIKTTELNMTGIARDFVAQLVQGGLR